MYFDSDGTREDNSARIQQYRTERNGAATTSSLRRVVVAYLVDNISYIEDEINNTLWPGMQLYLDESYVISV